MAGRTSVMFLVAFLFFSVGSQGTDLSGSLLYDDQLLASVFTDITATSVAAYPRGGGDEIEGTVDLATSSYSITGLAASEYGIQIYLDRTEPTNNVGNAGDLRAYLSVEITDPQGAVQQDIDIRYNYRVLSPIDSNSPLNGMGHDCTAHPTVAYPITFTIEPVPRAVSYEFTGLLYACPPANVGVVRIDSTEPSAEIEWGTAGEDYQSLYVTCVGAGGKELCTVPLFYYDDWAVWGLNLRNQDASGRNIHRSDAVVIPAVAGTPGAQGTYWSSAVSVANLLAADRQITFTFTPRNSDGLESYTSTTVTLSSSSQLSWSNVLVDLFSTTGAGALEIRGHDLAVTSRTSTPGDEDGSYGQGIPPIQPDQVLSVGGTDSATMGGVEEGTAFRTNLGLCEVWGEPATVTVVIMDASMTELGRRSYQLRAYENIQVNQVVTAVAGANSLSDGMAMVTVKSGDGRIGAYLSVVDNATGDPTFIAIAPQSPFGG